MDSTMRVRSGKQVLAIVLLIGIGVGAGLGLIIGTSPDIHHIAISGYIIFYPTPLGMALYGATAATAGLTTILGVVIALSRFDQYDNNF